jgi:outer membrane protein OmpA-like peptidoglycan-associated protein
MAFLCRYVTGNGIEKMKQWKSFLVVFVLFGLMVSCSVKRDLVVPPPEARDPVVAAPANRDLIVLLPDPDGKVGTIRVTTKGGSQTLDKPGQAIQIEGVDEPSTAPKPLEEREITKVFGPALAAQPDLKERFVSFVLLFDRDTTKLTRESKKLLPEVVRTIRNRKSSEVYVTGHTDRVGAEGYNMGLSSRRADTVRDFLVSTGVTSSALVVSFHGESMPLVHTEDEVPEPRNRRVEVIVR